MNSIAEIYMPKFHKIFSVTELLIFIPTYMGGEASNYVKCYVQDDSIWKSSISQQQQDSALLPYKRWSFLNNT